MACELCEHCHGPVGQNETFTVREGYSYHEKCHKCFVCSETNLQDADIFQGVIFCSSCAQRIFQSCNTARRRKTKARQREKSQKRRSHRTRDHRSACTDGILELTTRRPSDTSDSTDHQSKLSKEKSKTDSLSKSLTVRSGKDGNEKVYSLKRSSVEMGMTTEVTQELLKQMNCPVVTDCRKPAQLDKPKTQTKEHRTKKTVCSDLRIAELGASTEIANMALRNKSEQPVIVKSDVGKLESRSLSVLNRESGGEDWIDSAYSSLADSSRTHWMDRRFGSILKLPYKAFKKNILERSSLISVLMSTENDKNSLMNQIKLLFHEEISDHQRRGLKKLYSTINKNKTPNKLGWLDVTINMCTNNLIKRSSPDHYCHKRCNHFRTSHSYRCMRSQVMRLAGPTVSELAGFRNKMKKFVSPGFIKTIGNNKNSPAIMMSEACGNSVQGSSKV